MRSWWDFLKRRWLWMLGLVALVITSLLLLLRYPATEQAIYEFTDPSAYEVSDPAKVQVANGSVHLTKEGQKDPASNTYVVTKTPVAYNSLSGFSEELAPDNQGDVGYQLSTNGRDWQYWNGQEWAPAETGSFDQSNNAPTVNEYIDEYGDQTGQGQLYTLATLHAPSANTQVSLTSFSVGLQPLAAGVSVDSASPATGTTDGGTIVTLSGSSFYSYGPYRTVVNILNNDVDQTDYQLLLTIDTASLVAAGKMRPDGADIRILDQSGQNALPFWVDPNTMNSPATKIWVRVPSLPSFTYTTLLVNYGNPLLASASNAAATFPKQLTGAQAVWPMEENIHGSFMDYSGNSNSYGSTSSSGKVITGKYGLGRGFDASQGAVPIPSSNTMRPTTAITLESWVYPIATSGVMPIINAFSGTSSYAWQLDATNKLYFYMYLNGVRQDLITPTGLPINTWSHVAATYDSTTGQMKQYVNGVEVASQTVTPYPMTQPNAPVNIGGNSHATNIDELRIYNRVLSPSEITDSYNSQGISTPLVPNTVMLAKKQAAADITVDIEDAADLNVKFGGQTARIVSKSSTGSIKVQAPPHAAGPVDITVTNPDGTNATLSNGYTYAPDVKPPPSGNAPNPIGGNTTGGNKVSIPGGNIYKLGQYRRQITLNNPSTSSQTDYQVKVTMDTTAAVAAGRMKADGSDIRIVDSDKGTTLNYWIEPGTLDTANTIIWVRVPYIGYLQSKTLWMTYGNSVNPAASNPDTTFVRSIAGVQGMWSMDEASGTNVADSSGNNLAGTSTTAANIVPGVFGNSRSVGTQYVSIPHSGLLKPTGTTYTLETWVKPAAYGNQSNVVAADTAYLALNFQASGCYSSAQFCFFLNGKNFTQSHAPISLNTWYHVVATYDGAAIKIYVNGILRNSRAVTGNISASSTNKECFGWNTYNNSICTNTNPFTGSVDEVRIYDKTLSASEVADLYNNYGSATPTHPRTVLVSKRPATAATTANVSSEESYGPTVTFGGVPATDVTVTDTGLSVTAPAHAAGSVDVAVTNPDGQSFTQPSSYLYAGTPIINTVAPNRVSSVGGDTITISGSDFRSPPEVKIGGVVASNVTVVNSSTLQVVAPPHAPGPVDIVVTNPDGQTVTASRSITYLGNAPALYSVSPNNGPSQGGTVVTLNGANFNTLGGYRLPVTVTNSGTALTDYQVQLSINTASLISAGKMRYDAGDLRVDLDGVTMLPFWIEATTVGTTDTKVWVKVPSLPPGDTTLNITYGNPALTSASNSAAVFARTVPNAKAFFSLDESSASAAADSFGTVGAPASITSATVVPGKFGNARSFTGAGRIQYTTVPAIRPTTAVTLETWVNFATIKAQDIVGNLLSNANQSLVMDAGGLINFQVYTGAMRTITAPGVPSTNTWHHIAGTYDSATGVQSLYIDGVLAASQTISGNIVASSSSYLCLSGNPTNNCASNNLTGALDEVRIYDRALSAAEVTSLAGGYAIVLGGAANTMAVVQPRASGLNITTGSEVQGDILVTFDGVAAPLLEKPTSSSLKVIAPAHAAGVVDVQVTNPDNQTTTLASSFTYTSGVAVNGVTPSRGGAAGGTNVTIGGSGFFAGGTFRTPVSISNSSGANVTDYQVPVTIDTAALIAAGKMKPDGADIRVIDSDGVTTLSYWIAPGTINTANTEIWLRVPFMLANSSRVMSLTYGNPGATAASNQAATFRKVIPGVQGEWHMDEASGTSVADSSGNGFTGTAGAAAVVTSGGRFGNARLFDGITTTSAVSVTSNTTLRPTAAVAAEAWFFSQNPSLSQSIVANLGAGTGYGITLNFATGDTSCDNSLCFAVGVNSAMKGVGIPSSTLKANTWYHVVGTYDGTAVKLYLNGTEVASRAQTGAITQSTQPICIGMRPAATCTTTSVLKGILDEVRLYNRALAADEVSSLYNGYGLASTTQPRTVLVGTPKVSGVSLIPSASEAFGGSVTFGGAQATNIGGTSTNLTATTPPHPLGEVDVTATNPGGASATLAKGYKYTVYGYKFLNAPLTLLQNEPGTLTIQPVDEFGNAVVTSEDITLNVGTTSPSGFFARDLNEDPSTRWGYDSVVLPAGAAQAVVYYKDSNKGSPVITANGPVADGSLAASQTEQITSQYRLEITGVSSPIQSGVPSSVTIRAVDYLGQPFAGYTGTIHFTSNDAGAVLPSDFTFTPDLLGTKTFLNGVTMVTQGDWCVTATDANDSDITGSQCSVQVTAPNNGAPAKLSFITPPRTLSSGVASGVMTVQSQDTNGAPAPVSGNTSIYLYSASPTGEFSSDGVAWVGSGQSVIIRAGTTSVNFYYRDAASGTHQLTARDDQGTGTDFALTNATQNATVSGGPVFRLAILPPGGQLTAGATSGAFQVMVQDQFGNTAAPPASDLPVWVTSGSATARFSPDGDFSGNLAELALNISAGNTSATFYYVDTKAGDRLIAASDSSPPNGDTGLVDASRTVNVQAGSAAAINFTSLPQQVVAGEVSGIMTVQLTDQYGNATNAASDTTLYLSGAQAGAQFFAADGTTPASQVTVPGGQSSAGFTFKQNSFTPLQTIVVSDGSPADGAVGLTDGSQQQTITGGTPSKLVIATPTPSATPAGTKHSIRVELQNQQGVVIPSSGGTILYLRTTSGGGSFSAASIPWSPVTTLTIPDGQDHLDIYYQDTLAGSATITIADEASGNDVGLTNTSQTIQTVAAAAGKLHITTAPKVLQAGQASGAITVRLEDQYGNTVVAGSNTTVTLSTSSPDGDFDTNSGGPFNGSITTVVIPSGQSTVNFYYKDLKAGSPLITVSRVGLTDATQTQTINWGAVTILQLGTVPSVVAGQASAAITVSARNSYNTPVELPADLAVNLTVNSVTGRFDTSAGGPFDASITSITIPAGQSDGAFYFSDTKTGTRTVTATAGSTSGNRSVVVIAADPVKLLITTSQQNLEVGQRSGAITVQLYDQFQNVAKAVSPVTVSFSTTSVTGRFVNASEVDIPNVVIPAGNSSANFYYMDTTIGSPSLTLTATGLEGVTQTQQVTYGAPKKFSLSSAKSTLLTGEVVAMTVYAVNASDEVIPAPSDIVVNLTSSSTEGRFDLDSGGEFDGQITTVTILAGNTSANFYYRDAKAGSPTVIAQQTGYTSGGYTFNVTASAVYKVAFTNAVRTTAAGGTSLVLTLRLQDQYGNVQVAPSARVITVHHPEATAKLSATSGGTFNTGDLSLNMNIGDASVNFYYKDTVAGTKTLTASSSSLQDGTQNTTVTPASFHHIGITTAEQTIAAKVASGPITFTGYDQYNNPRSIAPAAPPLILNLTSGSPGGQFSTTASPWSPTTQLSIPNNTTTATFYYQDSVIGGTVMTLTSPSSVVPPISQAITITPGSPAGLSFTSAPQTVVKGTPSGPISVALVDQFGYTTTSGQSVQVHLSSESASGEFSQDGTSGWTSTLDLTYSAGQSSATFFYRDSATGGPALQASGDGLVSDSQVIAIVPGEIAKIGITAQTPVTAGQPTPVTIQTLTADDSPAAVAQDTTITLASDSGAEFSLDEADWQAVSNIVIPAGQYSVQLFYRNTTAGSDTVHAVPPDASGWQTGNTTINVTAAAFVKLGFQALPATVPVGSASGAMVVQARDQFGNLVLPGSDQTLYLYGAPTGSFAADPGGPWTLDRITMPAGTGTATFYYRDTLPGVQKTLTVSDQTPLDAPDAGLQNAVGQISVTSLPPSKVVVNYSGPSVTAGELSGPVVIEARQPDDSPAVLATDLVIDLTSDSPNGRFFTSTAGGAQPVIQAVIPAGQSQVTVYFNSEKSGDITLTAGSAGLQNGADTMTIVGADPTQLAFLTIPQVRAAGTESGQIRAQLQDRFGNPATSTGTVTIDLSTNSPTGQFSPGGGAGWAPTTTLDLLPGSSDAYFYYKDTVIGLWQIGVATNSLADIAGDDQTFSVQAGTAARLVFTSVSPTLEAGQTSGPLNITITDAFGNVTSPSVDLTLHLGSSSGGGTFSATADFAATTTTLPFPTGQQTVTIFYKDLNPGTPAIEAADLPLPDTPDSGLTNAFLSATIQPGTAVKLDMKGPATLVAGQSAPYTITLLNQYGAPVAATQDQTIQLSGPGTFSLTNFGAATQSAVIGTGSSSMTFYYLDTVAGPGTLTAADEASGPDTGLVNGTTSVSVLPADLARLRFINTPLNLEAGQVSGPLAIQAQDEFGNVVIVPGGLTLYLNSSATSGKFSLDNTFATTVTQVAILPGGNSAALYYRDSAPGTPLITVSDLPVPDVPDQGLLNATLDATITPGTLTQLVWSGWPASLEAGQVAGPLKVQAQNQYGVALPVSSDLTLQLGHTAARSGFAASVGGPWDLNSAVIPSGSSEIQLYYRALDPGSDTVTVADNAVAGPDTGLSDAVQAVSTSAGVANYVAITNTPFSVVARHTSPQFTVEIRSQYGGAVPASTDTRLYLRTTSGAGEFAASTSGPWGLNYVTVSAGQSAVSFYYRDTNVGSPIITVTDNLPPTPDVGLTNATQTQTITRQTMHHFLVTNITSPQTQGTPSSVVVVAQDSGNYVVSDYDGTVTFTSDDPQAVLPSSYTFQPATDKGSHTFMNGVAFPTSGIKTVTVTDQDSITGSQTDIVVNPNTAGPITGVRFLNPPDPFELNRMAASPPLVLESIDSQGQPSNAPGGGFPVRLTSTSPGGQFATSPTGPWSNELVTSFAAGFSVHTIYYQDSVVGTPTIHVSDWIGNSDDPGLGNTSLDVTVLQSDHFQVSAPANAVAGQAFDVTLTSVDQNGDLVPAYNGEKTVLFSAPANAPGGQAPAYPATVTFTDGVGTASVTLYNAETVKLAAEEGLLIGESADITVAPAAAASLNVVAPGVVTAGQQFAVDIEALDAYGNHATGFSGSQPFAWSGPGNSPDGTTPDYPAAVTFTGGQGTGQMTLYKREIVTLHATSGTLQGSSSLISVDTAAASSIVMRSGDQQSGPVSQLLPQPLVVAVSDAYGNPVDSYTVNFNVTAGGGRLLADSVVTAADGTAQTDWVLGPTPGSNNNMVEAVAAGLTGSPIVFTASAEANGFVITTPSTVTAGEPFTVQIKLVDSKGNVVSDYTGKKTLQFSGPANGPSGQVPLYPVDVEFVNGVAQPDPEITLVAAETTSLTATEGDLGGTALPFTVRAGLGAKLAVTSPPYQIQAGDPSGPITVCLQDEFGNATVAAQKGVLDLSSSSASGEFASAPTGPWNSGEISINIGESCTNVYYRDQTEGAFTLTFASQGLVSASQAVNVIPKPEPEPEPEPGPGPTPTPTPTPTPPAGGEPSPAPTPAPSPPAVASTITVYSQDPTIPSSVPSASPTVAVPLPVTAFPVINSPTPNTVITPLSGDIIVSGVGPPSQALRIKTEDNRALAATTADKNGNWIVHIARQQFLGRRQVIYAELGDGGARSPNITFIIKSETFRERIVRWWSQ